MSSKAVDGILSRYEALLVEPKACASVLQDIDDLITLNQYGFNRTIQDGEEATDVLFDSTAPNANDAFAAFLGGNQMSRAYLWASLRFRDEDLNDDDEATEWLERQNLRMIRAFNQSTLYAAGHQWLRDLTGLGTGILFQPDAEAVKGKRFPGFMFHSIPLANAGISENHDGFVDTLIRPYKISLRAYLRKFGKKGEARLGESARKAVADGNLDKELNCLHAVYPRDPDLVSDDAPSDTAMPWASEYMDRDDKVMLMESGYMEFPFHVARWDKTPGKVLGRGRGHIAIAHVKSLNKAVEMGMESEAMAISPPTKGLPGVTRAINSGPREHTVVDRMDAFTELYPGGFLRNAVESKRITVADYRAEVREMFYAHLLQMPAGPMMTAYEFAKRLEMTQRTVGPQLGRIESEGMTPLMRRSFAMGMRSGLFEPPPAQVLASDAAIDVEYQGPLAKNQRLGEHEGKERLIAFITSIYQLRQEAADSIAVDKMIQDSADILGVTKKNLEDAKAIAATRAQRQAAQDAATQAEGYRQDAIAMGKAAPAAALAMGGSNGGR